MTSSPTTSRTPSSASRAATRARLRARAAAKLADKIAAKESEERLSPGRSKVTVASIPSISSSSPPPVDLDSPHNYGCARYPRSSAQVANTSCDLAQRHSSQSDPITVSDSYSHTWITKETREGERVCPETDPPLMFKRYPTSENARITQPGEQARENANLIPLTVRPKVKLYREPEEYDTENTQDPRAFESDSPYIPGPDADNNLRCLKWLRNVGPNEAFNETATWETRAEGDRA